VEGGEREGEEGKQPVRDMSVRKQQRGSRKSEKRLKMYVQKE
jgi:hypothetical protein